MKTNRRSFFGLLAALALPWRKPESAGGRSKSGHKPRMLAVYAKLHPDYRGGSCVLVTAEDRDFSFGVRRVAMDVGRLAILLGSIPFLGYPVCRWIDAAEHGRFWRVECNDMLDVWVTDGVSADWVLLRDCLESGPHRRYADMQGGCLYG